jgi:hypothetical protein
VKVRSQRRRHSSSRTTRRRRESLYQMRAVRRNRGQNAYSGA